MPNGERMRVGEILNMWNRDSDWQVKHRETRMSTGCAQTPNDDSPV